MEEKGHAIFSNVMEVSPFYVEKRSCLSVREVSEEWSYPRCFGDFARITVLFLSCVGESGVLVAFDTIFDILVFTELPAARDSRSRKKNGG